MWPILLLLLIIVLSGIWLWRGRMLKDRLWWLAWLVPVASLIMFAVLIKRDPVLQKTVGLLSMPAGLAWVALALGSLISWLRWQKKSAVAWTGIFLMYTLAGNVWLGTALQSFLEHQVQLPPQESLRNFDAICVLGGGSALAEDGTVQFGTGGDRIALAAAMFKAKKTAALVCSGSSIDGIDQKRDLANETSLLWQGLGVPKNAIHCVSEPTTTAQEIEAYKQLIDREGWSRVGLITSASHLPRALRNCRRAGLEVVPIAADRCGALAPFTSLYVIPQGSGFMRMHIACWEFVGLLAGH